MMKTKLLENKSWGGYRIARMSNAGLEMEGATPNTWAVYAPGFGPDNGTAVEYFDLKRDAVFFIMSELKSRT